MKAARLAVLAALLLGIAVLAPAGASANDSIATAEGPLLNGQTATGTIGTENDVDWYFFYAGSGTETDIALLGLASESCFGPEVTLTDADGRELASTEYPADRNETKHARRTVGPGTFYLKVEPYYLDILYCGHFGAEYGYRLGVTGTPSLLSTAPYVPPPPSTTTTPSGSGGSPGTSSACRQARSRVSSLSSRLRRARGLRLRRRIRAQLRQAQAQVRSVC